MEGYASRIERKHTGLRKYLVVGMSLQLNAMLINDGMPQQEWLEKLNAIAISQMKILTQDHGIGELEAHSGEK